MNGLSTAAAFVSAIAVPVAAMAGGHTVPFTVGNMTCASCPYIARKTMARVPDVTKAGVSFADKAAAVTFDDATRKPGAIAGASAGAGYPAKPVRQER